MNESRTHPAIKILQDLLDERGINKSEFARQLGWGRMQVHRRLNGEADLSVQVAWRVRGSAAARPCLPGHHRRICAGRQ